MCTDKINGHHMQELCRRVSQVSGTWGWWVDIGKGREEYLHLFLAKNIPCCKFWFRGTDLEQEKEKITNVHGGTGKYDEILDLLATLLAM